ncbi:MAG: TIGR04282 family arsenosugar biosynthesis glycosyltransferase [Chloroherpetonaceae bacterium]|nr:TIGR04282 family arsenosugar biosynthesis glycosyltransferase [Chloroherpetonaceae bacterium]
MSAALIVFFKAPEVGKVKTRLLPALSPDDATRLCACFIEDTFEKASSLPVQVLGFVAGTLDEESELARFLARKNVRLERQVGNDLGERLSNAFRACFERGFARVCVVGTDSPDLPLAIVERAFETLADERPTLVIAGASDGGYVLLGMNRYFPEAFQNVPYSSSQTYEATLAQLRATRANVVELETWHDIDEPQDLERLLNSPFPNVAPKSIDFLKRLSMSGRIGASESTKRVQNQ